MQSPVRLECEWVLRNVYGFARREVAAALRAFAGFPGVSLEHPAHVAEAFDHSEAGMDFADALHPGAAAHCGAFPTFDRRLMDMAGEAGFETAEP